MAPPYRSGFVALAGRPNVGKSTLLNRLVGQKVAITANRPQTTRNRITGVCHGDGFQAIFLDNPGIHRPTHALNRIMVRTALEGLAEMDLLFFMVEPDRQPGGGDRYVAEALHDLGPPVWLLMNKIDTVSRADLLAAIDAFKDLATFEEVFPISARTGDNVDELLRAVGRRLPEGPEYFPAGMVTDLPENFVLAELIREQVIRRLREELPYGVAVRLDGVEEEADRPLTRVVATIIVDRENHKGMVIGAKGSRLKAIGSEARRTIERLLGTAVFLDLRVVASPNWRNEVERLRALGFEA
jgi:GTP-binding protein Era